MRGRLLALCTQKCVLFGLNAVALAHTSSPGCRTCPPLVPRLLHLPTPPSRANHADDATHVLSKSKFKNANLRSPLSASRSATGAGETERPGRVSRTRFNHAITQIRDSFIIRPDGGKRDFCINLTPIGNTVALQSSTRAGACFNFLMIFLEAPQPIFGQDHSVKVKTYHKTPKIFTH